MGLGRSFSPHQGIFCFVGMAEKLSKFFWALSFSPHQGIFCFVGKAKFTPEFAQRIAFQSPSGDFLFCWWDNENGVFIGAYQSLSFSPHQGIFCFVGDIPSNSKVWKWF